MKPPRAGRGPIALLLHRGHGPVHLDIVLGIGTACPTFRLGSTASERWPGRTGGPLPGRTEGLFPSLLPAGGGRTSRQRALARLLARRPLSCAPGAPHRRRWLTAGGHASGGRGHATLLLRTATRWAPIRGGLRIFMPGLVLDLRRGLAVVSLPSRVTLG